MASNNGSKMIGVGGFSPVDGLALSVISQVSASPNKRRNRRIEIGANLLFNAVLSAGPYDQTQMRADLDAFRISATDIIDHCIPLVAIRLGEGWVDDTIPFTKVATASARLYGLCKDAGQEWDGLRQPLNARNLLLTTLEREDHIIGPAVLAEQLRRRGHSVKVLANSTSADILSHLAQDRFDGVLISISNLHTLAHAHKVIKNLKNQSVRPPLILGGACLGFAENDVRKIGADLVTNDIDEALDAIVGDDIDLRVAE